ncbi:hypothetical protein [Rubellicoccus peritrichatus]|uniref:PEP-CTERM protein-sorting domain-containing protein n=1 Tax=Rubellicoccus peritrichatus TaxID=3080537 RepID=A0AAQ3L6B4_9BACT|nr:hypothetical protein [Puniceicoccus sp. CR14]WOO40304.1 hypothetical protein RZN69_16920 [Puniceicoccus sp. CR14]
MKFPNTYRLAAACLFLTTPSIAIGLSTKYFIDFDNASNVIGNPVALDNGASPRTSPSALLGGTSEVMAAGATPFATKSLSLIPQLQSGFTISQYEFDLVSAEVDSLSISFDLVLSNFVDDASGAFIPDNQRDYFSLLIDTPNVERIDFAATGTSGTGRILVHGGTQQIGTFAYDSIMSVSIDIDVAANSWGIDLIQDSLSIGSLASGTTFFEEFGAVTYSGMIESFRLALVDGGGDGDGSSPEAYLDNLQAVPEPSLWVSTIALLALAVAVKRRLRRGALSHDQYESSNMRL